MGIPAAHQQALDALLSFGRNGRLEERTYYAAHRLGDSPHDAGYMVSVVLAVVYSISGKTYRVRLTIIETRYDHGLASERIEREMPVRRLSEVAGTRFSAKRVQAIYDETVAALRKNPQPLIDLLEEESERS